MQCQHLPGSNPRQVGSIQLCFNFLTKKKKSVLEIFLSIYFELGAHLNQVCNCLAPNLLDIVGGKGTWDQEPEVSQEYVGSINDNPKRRQTHF